MNSNDRVVQVRSSDTDRDFRMKTFPVLTARREREKVLRGGKVEDESLNPP